MSSHSLLHNEIHQRIDELQRRQVHVLALTLRYAHMYAQTSEMRSVARIGGDSPDPQLVSVSQESKTTPIYKFRLNQTYQMNYSEWLTSRGTDARVVRPSQRRLIISFPRDMIDTPEQYKDFGEVPEFVRDAQEIKERINAQK